MHPIQPSILKQEYLARDTWHAWVPPDEWGGSPPPQRCYLNLFWFRDFCQTLHLGLQCFLFNYGSFPFRSTLKVPSSFHTLILTAFFSDNWLFLEAQKHFCDSSSDVDSWDWLSDFLVWGKSDAVELEVCPGVPCLAHSHMLLSNGDSALDTLEMSAVESLRVRWAHPGDPRACFPGRLQQELPPQLGCVEGAQKATWWFQEIPSSPR